MSAETIITSPALLSVLDAASHARQQCIDLLKLLDDHPTTPTQRDYTSDPALEQALAAQQKMLYSHLSTVRRLNRAAIQSVRTEKQATADARGEIDTLHLQLQNLEYEQRHLRGEIAGCEAYDHKYTLLPLLPLDEFLQTHPSHATDDENTVMRARIEHELESWQALEERRQGLLKKKQGLIAENKKRKEDLANLDKDLEKFIEAADPIMKTFEKEY